LSLLFVSQHVEATRAHDAVFYDGEIGFGLIVLMAGSILCSGWVAGYVDRLFPRDVREYLGVRGVELTLRKGGAWISRRASRGITTTVPELFFEEQARVTRRWFMVPALTLLLAGALAVSYDLASYDIGTTHRIERHSPFGVERVSYDEVAFLEVGCARAGRSVRGIYTLILRGGDRISAFSRGCCGDTIRQLASLDRELRDRGVQVHAAADDDGRPLSDQRCERQLAERSGVPVELVHGLLTP
jgi:hypothetical protein